MPTVREIADRAGVSISTVSLALNNKKGISDSTRQHILRVAAELDAAERDESNAHSAPQNDHRPQIIMGLHPPKVSDEVFSNFLRGMWAAIAGTNTQLQMTVNEANLEENNISQLFFSDADLLPDGLVALGSKKEEPIIQQALEAGVPCVLVQRETDRTDLSAVGIDEVQTARDVTEHLIELGHREIAFIGGEQAYSYTDSRLEGYRQAMAAHGISVPDHWVALGWDQATTRKVLTAAPDITGIVFINDGFALRFGMPVLDTLGLRVPDDVSVASFDNIEAARSYDPPITSAELPFYEISYRAVKVLRQLIDDPLISSLHIRLNAVLHKRASCAAPRAAH